MNVICQFSHPEEMKKIIDYLNEKNWVINCNLETLEKMWYIYSEKCGATWLYPNKYLIEGFIEYVKWIDIKDAERMDYYGNIIGEED